jgi:hypothetical protein
MEFTKPLAGGGYFKAKDRLGHLILITAVHDSRPRYDELKKSEVIEMRCDIVDLDEPGQELQEGLWVSYAGITNRIKVGLTNILGRIGTLDTGKGNPAFVLEDFADADVPRAQAWVEAHAKSAFAQPAAAPAPAPVTTTEVKAANPNPALDPEMVKAAMEALQAQGLAPTA